MQNDSVVSTWQCHAASDSTIEVLPDGCRDLIAIIPASGQIQLLLTGIDPTSYHVTCKTGDTFYGIRLAAGSRAKWERSPNSQLSELNQTHGLNSALINNKLQQLKQQPSEIIHTLNEWQQKNFVSSSNLVDEYLTCLQTGQTIQHTSERTLRRHLTQQSGKAPKFWQQLYRARSASQSLCQNTPVSDVIDKFDYVDQSHLCRDLKRWFNVSPGSLQTQAELYRDLFNSEDAFQR